MASRVGNTAKALRLEVVIGAVRSAKPAAESELRTARDAALAIMVADGIPAPVAAARADRLRDALRNFAAGLAAVRPAADELDAALNAVYREAGE